MKRKLRDLLAGGSFGEVSPARRKVMRANAAKHTGPEMAVRSLVHGMGYRYRLHRRDLPGQPDIVLPRWRKIIEVRGCYWHMHDCPLGRRKPQHNAEYWAAKRSGNVVRDARNLSLLEHLGWRVLIVWECQTKGGAREDLKGQLLEFLRG